MNTIQINTVLKNHPSTKQFYLGTFSLDKMPKKIRYPSCFILNNQKSTEGGEHWLAVYFDKNKRAEFFDSFAKPPSYYGAQEYLDKHSISVKHNKRVLQTKFTAYCGIYSILFIIFKCKSQTLNSFLKYFDSSHNNDKNFTKLINKYG